MPVPAPQTAEYQALSHGAGLFDLSDRQFLRVTGSDRVEFLQGMVTNDVSGLPTPGHAYAALLTVKGAMVADCLVLRRADDLLVQTEPGLGEKVLAFLNTYLISEDAELHDATAEWTAVSLLGPQAGAVLKRVLDVELPISPQAHEAQWQGHQVYVVPAQLPGGGGADVWLPRPAHAEAVRALTEAGAVPVGADTWEVRRVELGVPRYGQDMVDTTIPLEANLERAIHYKKGCYIGQEVIARATFRGRMNRKLVGLLLGEAEPAPGEDLRVEDRKVGWVTSVARSSRLGQVVALGYVHRDLLTPGTELQLGSSGTKATVQALPLSA